MMRFFIALVVMTCVLVFPGYGEADWQSTLDTQGFDIVETFDNLQDWLPSPVRGRNYSGLPKLADGSASMWNLYDWWPTVAPGTTPWIRNHGPSNVWRGDGKSLIMDLDSNDSDANSGPARFGLYFGTGTADGVNPYSSTGVVQSGYRADAYIFYMIKFPTGAFPKTGNAFNYFDYYKLNTLSTGFTAAGVAQEGTVDYGASNIHTNLASGASYGNNLHVVLQYFTDANWAGVADPNIYHATGSYSIGGYVDGASWFGIEIHVHRGTPGGGDGYQEVWIYDASGNAVYGGKTANYSMVPIGKDWGFNRFWFGGNRSFGGTPSTYYVDDFIMDSGRIGPAYFAALASYQGGGSPSDTTPPSCAPFAFAATSTSLTVPVSTPISCTDNVGVTGYVLSEVSNPPASGTVGSPTVPTSLTFGGVGIRTGYLYARDAAGNWSNVRSSSTTISEARIPSGTSGTVLGIRGRSIVSPTGRGWMSFGQ